QWRTEWVMLSEPELVLHEHCGRFDLRPEKSTETFARQIADRAGAAKCRHQSLPRVSRWENPAPWQSSEFREGSAPRRAGTFRALPRARRDAASCRCPFAGNGNPQTAFELHFPGVRYPGPDRPAQGGHTWDRPTEVALSNCTNDTAQPHALCATSV